MKVDMFGKRKTGLRTLNRNTEINCIQQIDKERIFQLTEIKQANKCSFSNYIQLKLIAVTRCQRLFGTVQLLVNLRALQREKQKGQLIKQLYRAFIVIAIFISCCHFILFTIFYVQFYPQSPFIFSRIPYFYVHLACLLLQHLKQNQSSHASVLTPMKPSINQSPHLNNSIFNNSSHQPQKPDRIQQNNLKKIEEHVSAFYSAPQCKGFCECHICKQKYSILDKGKAFMRQTSSLIKIDTSRIKIFFRLMSAASNKVCFRLQIPTLCFFDKGQCKLMFKSKNEYIILEENHQVSKKNVANFFVQANKKKSNPGLINKNKDNHLRHFNTVVPSYIHGSTEQTSQMKEAKNFFFHIDSRLENEQFYMVEKNVSDEVAIVKYLENKGFQLLNEKQLRQLLKSPINTQCIDFIQSYIKPHQVESEFFFSQYNGFNPIQNNLMWSRSSTQVKISINLINSYSKDYVPIETLESYEQLLKEIPQEYILYQNYKMVHYLELVRNLKIKTLTTVWIKDEFREICFFSIVNFQYDENTVTEADLSQSYAIREMIDKPFTDLENELWGMWEKTKQKKLKELTEKSSQKDISVVMNNKRT